MRKNSSVWACIFDDVDFKSSFKYTHGPYNSSKGSSIMRIRNLFGIVALLSANNAELPIAAFLFTYNIRLEKELTLV